MIDDTKQPDQKPEPSQDLEKLGDASQEIIDKVKGESYSFLNPSMWTAMQHVAKVFLNSGAMPKQLDTLPKIMVVLQAGKESGLQPLESISSFYLVNGKVAIYGEMKIALVRKAGHKISWGLCDDTMANVTITRRDTGEKMASTFTMEMAKDRHLTGNDVWAKYPETMLKYKAFDMVAKFIVPDALHGVMSEQEVIEREIVEAEVIPKEDTTEEKPKDVPVSKPSKTLDEAIKEEDEPEVEMPGKTVEKSEPVEPKTKSKARLKMEEGLKKSEKEI